LSYVVIFDQVPVTGFKTPFRDGYVRDLAEEVLKLAKNGLERRGYKEVGFLREVEETVGTGNAPTLFSIFKSSFIWRRQ
jgi:glutamate--cysteine ligase